MYYFGGVHRFVGKLFNVFDGSSRDFRPCRMPFGAQ
jgi:hypothetical protein